MNENLKWNILKEKVQQASEMKPGDNVHGIKTAYRSVLKLMDMIEDGDFLDDAMFDNGMKTVNIFEPMMVYEISHTLDNQSEYVAANSPAEAIEKLKNFYITDNFPDGRINDKDIISIVNLGDLIL